MRVRGRGRLLVLLLCALGAAACTGEANTPAPCPSCAGCCREGQCLPGLSAEACGAGGASCSACPPGATCQQGVCTAVLSCSCPAGCCDAAGVCQTGTAATACGAGGNRCADCAALGQTCDAAARQCTSGKPPPPAGCSQCPPASCCLNDRCQDGAADATCGAGGWPCVNCTLTGQSCDPGLRVCAGCPSCSDGCCVGQECRPGTADDTCGGGGSACVDCTLVGQKCGPQGGTRSCVPLCADCAGGCCFGPSCVAGTGDSACGIGGAKCVDCAAVGSKCVATTRTCSNSTGCPNCSSGCCQGPTCVGGNSVFACGKDGDPCVNCLVQGMDKVCDPVQRICRDP